MHGLTEGRSVRPAVTPGEGNSPTIKPYREYVPLQKIELIILPQSIVSYRNTMSKSKEKEKHKDKFTFHLFHYFDFHCSEFGPMPR